MAAGRRKSRPQLSLPLLDHRHAALKHTDTHAELGGLVLRFLCAGVTPVSASVPRKNKKIIKPLIPFAGCRQQQLVCVFVGVCVPSFCSLGRCKLKRWESSSFQQRNLRKNNSQTLNRFDRSLIVIQKQINICLWSQWQEKFYMHTNDLLPTHSLNFSRHRALCGDSFVDINVDEKNETSNNLVISNGYKLNTQRCEGQKQPTEGPMQNTAWLRKVWRLQRSLGKNVLLCCSWSGDVGDWPHPGHLTG